MKFSPQQDQALKAVASWYHTSDKQVFRLFGYAGSGKTTLAKHLAEGIDGEVLFGAYTGKAAHVLKTKGCINAATIHSMIYRSKDKSKQRLKDLELELINLRNELSDLPQDIVNANTKVMSLEKEIMKEADNSSKPSFTLNRDSVVKDAALVIIDECSMIDERMGMDLLSFKTPVLVLGDPAQLPPIGGAGFFTEHVTPDFMLDEVHRQAAESPILRMATLVRNGKPLDIGDWGNNCRVHEKGTKLDPNDVMSFDQILTGKNVTRHMTNMKLRRLHGLHDPLPVPGDRLVCLKNNSEIGLLNGAIFMVKETDGLIDGKVHMNVNLEHSDFSVAVQSLEHHFVGRGEELKKQYWLKAEAHEFDYGYGLTVHKAQGSQWNSVCVFDESFCFKSSRNRWLYTAITRAAEQIDIVRM
jgi:exodeoxyribonuclease-5